MRFHRTQFQDAMIIEPERREDERGYFARTMCREEFAAHGLVADFVQANHSHNKRAGTLRGLHYQAAPHGEVKLVRCVRGAIFDVIVDLRSHSPTYMEAAGFALSAENGRILYVPAGFAHGFQTLVDDADVTYQVSYPYTPAAERGIRWNDPSFGISWPCAISAISEKDAAWPLFQAASGSTKAAAGTERPIGVQ